MAVSASAEKVIQLSVVPFQLGKAAAECMTSEVEGRLREPERVLEGPPRGPAHNVVVKDGPQSKVAILARFVVQCCSGVLTN